MATTITSTTGTTTDHHFAASRSQHDGGGEAGFALIVVIWITGLVALMTLSFSSSVRQHVHATASAVTIARLAALADGGVTLAAADLVRANLRRDRPSLLGRVHRCRLPGGEMLAVSVGDEAGKVDINIAGEEILTALFAGIGHGPTAARALADAVIDFRDSDDAPRASGAESAQYHDAGRAAGPRNAAFESIAELAQVLGIAADDMAKLRPLVTVRSGQEGIDMAAASPHLVATLARGAAATSLVGAVTHRAGGFEVLPDAFRVSSGLQAFGVRAAVTAPSGATFVREAVIGIAGARPSRDLRPASDLVGAVKARRPGGDRAEPARLPGIKVWEWNRARSATEPSPYNGVQSQSAC